MAVTSFNCSTLRFLQSTSTPTITVTPTITSSQTPTITSTLTYSPTSTKTSTEIEKLGILGTWYFTVIGDPWERSGFNHFYVTFNEDGTLVHKNVGSEDETGGKWSLQGDIIHFDINQYSFWDGEVHGDRMNGSVYNNAGESGTWSAVYQS